MANRDYAKISTAIWFHQPFHRLSIDGKLLALYFLSSPPWSLGDQFLNADSNLGWPLYKVQQAVDELVAAKLMSVTEGGLEAAELARFGRIRRHVPVGRVPGYIWKHIRAAIFKRDRYRCVYCGADDRPLECDHVVPISRGGDNSDGNLATACNRCNNSKRDKLLSEWRRQ